MRRRIPGRVRLSSGHIIKVIEVPQSILKEAVADAADNGLSTDLDAHGLWDDEKEVILINKSDTVKERWNTYWHELRHAINDIADIEQAR